MNWQEIVIKLLDERQLSLRAAAAELGVSHVFLSAVAKGSQPASSMLKLKLLNRLGYDLTRDTLLLVLPEEVAAEARRIDVQRGQKRAEKALSKIEKIPKAAKGLKK